jgi:hypothetical protein
MRMPTFMSLRLLNSFLRLHDLETQFAAQTTHMSSEH